MKKVIRLTESDLMRIVKRVMKENSNPKPISCSELDKLSAGRYDGFGLDLVKNELFPASEKVKGDDYGYVELYNGKVCYCFVGKNAMGPKSGQKWVESTDPKQKNAIIGHLKNSDFMDSYQDNKHPWKKQDDGTWRKG